MRFLSFSMIVKNEARCIVRCLESVVGFVDEVIVVDTGSTDDTVSLIEQFRADHPAVPVQILHYQWNDDFAAARNYGINHCSGEYIFTLDADEYVDAQHVQQFRQLVQFLRHSKDRYVVACQLMNLADDGVVPQISEKIFPNHPRIRYARRLHELLVIDKVPVKKYRIDATIWHDGYTSQVNQVQKKARNIKILNEMIQADPNDRLSLFYFARDLFGLNPAKSMELLQRLMRIIPDEEAYLREQCQLYLDKFSRELSERQVH